MSSNTWAPTPNLELMHYKIKYLKYGISATFIDAGIVTSNRAVITGLDFASVSDYKFLVIGGSRVKNTFDADARAAEILVSSSQSSTLEVQMTIFYVSDTSVALEWTRPWSPFSVYEVKYVVQVTLDSFDENALNNTRWIDQIADPNQGIYTTY